MSCTNCDPNCFDSIGDGCLELSITSEELGIVAGEDSLKTGLKKIIDEVVCLKDNACDPCNTCGRSTTTGTGSTTTGTGSTTTSSGVGNLSSLGGLQQNISGSTFVLKINPGKSSTAVEYDLRNLLPDENNNIINATIYGSDGGINTRLYQSSSQVGSYNATPENFPITLNIEVNSSGIKGQEVYKYQKILYNVFSQSNEYMNVTDLTTASITNQAEANEYFDGKIIGLQNQINSIKDVNFNGNNGVNSIFSDLQDQIKDLENTHDTEVSELEGEIEKLTEDSKIKEENITKLENLITQLQTRINTLESLNGL